MTAPPDSPGSLLVFREAESRFAVPLAAVAEVLHAPAGPVPGEGIAYRGGRLPIVALEASGGPEREAQVGERLIVLKRARPLALRVEAVEGLVEMGPRELSPADGFYVTGLLKKSLKAVGRAGGEPLFVLDPDALGEALARRAAERNPQARDAGPDPPRR